MTNSAWPRHLPWLNQRNLCRFGAGDANRVAIAFVSALSLFIVTSHPASAQDRSGPGGSGGSSRQGEPAEAFVKQLRNAGYFDTAITYLDRAGKLAGVDASFVKAIPLEKAQTFIESALATRNADNRDKAFADAEQALQQFLSANPEHPRTPEANLQLGKLQMIRAAQLLAGEPDAAERTKARESYLAASKTFDAIVTTLRSKLEAMRGQKIDPKEDPEAAALRDQYRFEFLQSQLNAADSLKLAAKTHDDPAKQGKANLDDAAKRFAELNKKYSSYIPGAIALMHLGDVNEVLGNNDQALDNYLKMLEQPDVDPLRESKYLAAAGLVRMKLAADPPKYQEAIDRVGPFAKQVRPDEKNLQAVQDYRLALAKAYLAKAADDSLKKGEIGRAKSEARELLAEAKKIPGTHVEQVETLLADLGIEQDTELLPTAEPPESFDDALEKATQVVTMASDLEQALNVLDGQASTPDLDKQKADIQKQIQQSYLIGIQTLRAGLAMIHSDTSNESINQARHILAYFLYQTKHYRETVVVGSFLARYAPGTDLGLKGGLMALTSMQVLLAEVPDDENAGLIRQLESLGKYMATTWPNDPNAAAAQGLQVRLLLKKSDFDGAQALIDEMDSGPERAEFKRLLGQLFWNESIVARVQDKDEKKSDMLVSRAKANLTEGLNGISGKLLEVEGMQAALVLAKLHLLKNDSAAAMKVLDHPKYGPLEWSKKLEAPSENFTGELYSTELKALVGQMLDADNPDQYLDRMTGTMEKLRDAYSGPEAQGKLTQSYMRLAQDLKDQLEGASPARKSKLIEAFRVLLKRISESSKDEATLRWVGQTLASMGESLMVAGQTKATDQAAELITQSIETFQSLSDQDDITTTYLLGRSQRLVGEFKASIDTFEQLLKSNPLMLEAQVEAAQAYESWAATLKPNYAYQAYRAALKGARPGKDKKNVVWGWDEISQKTINQIKRSDNFKEKFFESRYHVALCLYLMGKVADRESEKRKAMDVIRKVATLFPDLGGDDHRKKYDALMKEVQKAVGEKPTGL